MNNDNKMDVVDWRDTPQAVVTRAQRRLFSPTAIGFFGTLAIHALIVPTAYLGTRAAKVHPREIREASAFSKSNSDLNESLVLITLPTIPTSSGDISQDIRSLVVLNEPVAINVDPPTLVNIEVLTLGEDQSSPTTAASGEGAEQARLFGIYTGQIRARIERIWRRPRTAVSEVESEGSVSSDETFQCEAQIVQDAHGFVQEVLLPQCNGSRAWQISLVTAIQEASPLPAPPSASVFSHSIALSFVGLPYLSGSPDDE